MKWILIALIGLVGVVWAEEKQPVQTPRQITEKLVDDCLKILHDIKLNPDEKTTQIQSLIYERTDFKTVARLTLAQHWRDLNEKQQGEFIEAFKEHLSRVYANIGREYKNQRVKMLGDHELGRGDWLVQSDVIGDNNSSTKVDYRFRKTAGQWWIIDLMIEGQSMVTNFRSQFDDIIQREGFEKLMQVLKEKNIKGEK